MVEVEIGEVVVEVKVIVQETPSGRGLIGISRTKMTRKVTHLGELTGMVPYACQLLAPAKVNNEKWRSGGGSGNTPIYHVSNCFCGGDDCNIFRSFGSWHSVTLDQPAMLVQV